VGEGMGSHHRGPWMPTVGQGPRPCGREGAKRNDRQTTIHPLYKDNDNYNYINHTIISPNN